MQFAYFSVTRHAGVHTSPTSCRGCQRTPSPGPGPLIYLPSMWKVLKSNLALQYAPCRMHRLAATVKFPCFSLFPTRRILGSGHFLQKKLSGLTTKQVSSRENVLKINFALQYDLCKTHRLAVTGYFWHFCLFFALKSTKSVPVFWHI